MNTHSEYENAAELIAQEDGLIIAAGAGIGFDSGLPDLRGKEGFWKAYPALGRDQTRGRGNWCRNGNNFSAPIQPAHHP